MRLLPFLIPFGRVSVVLAFCYLGLVTGEDLVVPHEGYGKMTPPSEPYTYAPDDPQAKASADTEEENDGEEENTTPSAVDAEMANFRKNVQQHFENQRDKRHVPYSMFPLPPPADSIPPVQDEASLWRQPFDLTPPPPPQEEALTSESYSRRRLTKKKISKISDPWAGGTGSTSGLGLDDKYERDNTDADLDLDEDNNRERNWEDHREDDRDDYDEGSKRRKKREAGWNGGLPMQGNMSLGAVLPYPGGGIQQRPHEYRGNAGHGPERPGAYNGQNHTMQDRPGSPYGPASDRGHQPQGPHHAGSGYRENSRPHSPQHQQREPPRYDSGRPERRSHKTHGRKDGYDEDRSPYRRERGGRYNTRKEYNDDDRHEDDRRDRNRDRDEYEGPKREAGSREYHTGGKDERKDRPHRDNEHENCKDKKKELERCVLKLLLAHPHELYDKWCTQSTLSGRALLQSLRDKTDATKGEYRSDASESRLSDLVWNICDVIDEQNDGKSDGRPNGRPDRKPDSRNQEKYDETRDHKNAPSNSSDWSDVGAAIFLG
ncbi:hypothetical protein RvY_07384 [Ramazzottius varieornatus]|uniref:Uncharacterized protein n=1 Tax=Ramazzottius varieornatus TaxID=947166 RepID=A0A1D1V1Y9_RAMVA|nr:hypothetical protein RvY_07384 [Ramazzottius varieornatus]